MARRSTRTTAQATPAEVQHDALLPTQPTKLNRPDTAELEVEALAKVILAREIKPRVGEIRRLAEAVLRKKDRKKAKKALKAAGKGERKLSKIPGRKAKK